MRLFAAASRRYGNSARATLKTRLRHALISPASLSGDIMNTAITLLASALLLCGAQAAHGASANAAKIDQILKARSVNFAQFQGQPIADNTTTTRSWNATLAPFAMQCVIHDWSVVVSGYAYECSLTPASAAAAVTLDKELQAAFRAAVHGFNWWHIGGIPGIGGVPGELVGGTSQDSCYADITIDPASNKIDFEVFVNTFPKAAAE
jgi:hypothetical protein